MDEFWKLWRADFRSPMPVVIWLLVSGIAGFAGPFGTYQSHGLTERLVFWGLVMGLGIVLSTMIRALVIGVFGLRRFATGSPVIALILAVVMPFPLIALVDWLLPGAQPQPAPVEMAGFVFFVSLGVGALRRIVAAHRAPVPPEGGADLPVIPPAVLPVRPGPPPAVDDAASRPRLWRRLSGDMQGDLVAMSMRGHYVDIVTTQGRAALLMRFSDAMAEAEGVEGGQVHRSHWVAWQAVTGLERAEGKLHLAMAGGGRIPVSRPYRDLVEARFAGLPDPGAGGAAG